MINFFRQAAYCLTIAGITLFPTLGVDAGGSVAGAMQERRIIAPVRYTQFEVEVLVGGRTLDEIAARGKRYVEATEGAEYALRLRNPLPVRVAVALSVDGVNTIDARRTSSWDASKWVLEPYQTITITGWQMSNAHARKFYFTSERDSYAARIGRQNDLGVISAVFYRESAPVAVPVTPSYPQPDLERREPRGGSEESRQSEDKAASPSASASNSSSKRATANGVVAPGQDDEYAATGIGRSIENHVYRVQLQLQKQPAAETTLRYEYTDALYKLGVLPRPYNGGDPLRRRERARGFEDSRFCPEPPQK